MKKNKVDKQSEDSGVKDFSVGDFLRKLSPVSVVRGFFVLWKGSGLGVRVLSVLFAVGLSYLWIARPLFVSSWLLGFLEHFFAPAMFLAISAAFISVDVVLILIYGLTPVYAFFVCFFLFRMVSQVFRYFVMGERRV